MTLFVAQGDTSVAVPDSSSVTCGMRATARLTRHAPIAAAIVVAACGGGRVQSSASPTGAVACAAAPSATTPIDSAVVVVTSPIDLANAPHPTTFGETFVFGLTRERPDSIDCRGNALGVASYQARAAGPSTIALDPVRPDVRPRVTVLTASETKARDLADAGADLVITDSPALATYAANRPDAISIPLGYDRTWVVAIPRQGRIAIDSTIAFRESLARDVLRSNLTKSPDSLVVLGNEPLRELTPNAQREHCERNDRREREGEKQSAAKRHGDDGMIVIALSRVNTRFSRPRRATARRRVSISGTMAPGVRSQSAEASRSTTSRHWSCTERSSGKT